MILFPRHRRACPFSSPPSVFLRHWEVFVAFVPLATSINGGAAQIAGISFNADHTQVTFDFPPPVPVNTVILFHKELQYMDVDTIDNNVNAIVVNEFASVPEPSTWALMVIGVARKLRVPFAGASRQIHKSRAHHWSRCDF